MENQFRLATMAKGTRVCYRARKHLLESLKTTSAIGLLLISICACLYGCDPVRTVQQSVMVRVVDERGTPVSEVRVRMKESWESWKSTGSEVPEGEVNDYYERWSSEPWLEDMTDARGEARFLREVTALDWNKGSTPPVERDVVSAREYVFELSRQNVREENSVMLRKGAIGKGKAYTVSVESVGAPLYVTEPGAK